MRRSAPTRSTAKSHCLVLLLATRGAYPEQSSASDDPPRWQGTSGPMVPRPGRVVLENASIEQLTEWYAMCDSCSSPLRSGAEEARRLGTGGEVKKPVKQQDSRRRRRRYPVSYSVHGHGTRDTNLDSWPQRVMHDYRAKVRKAILKVVEEHWQMFEISHDDGDDDATLTYSATSKPLQARLLTWLSASW